MPVFYETEDALSQYLLFHYGNEEDLMPYPFGPRGSIHFPVRAVSETVAGRYTAALDLGCAVGRSSFELTRYCDRVVGVDYSASFIAAAQEILRTGCVEYSIDEEVRTALLPVGARPERATFVCADALTFLKTSPSFDLVFAANLLCRLPRPRAFLAALGHAVAEGGTLILTTPYSWLEDYTPRTEWIEGGLIGLQKELGEKFELVRAFDLPFLIREHVRKFQWGVAQATIWRRKTIDK